MRACALVLLAVGGADAYCNGMKNMGYGPRTSTVRSPSITRLLILI